MKTYNDKLETKEDESRRESVYSAASSIIIQSGPLAVLLNLFADFSNNSTVHGVKYLGERRRHWIERAFWVITFIISLIGPLVLIMKIYENWQLNPVIVSFAEKPTSIFQIPFPAVTICPETKSRTNQINFNKFRDSATFANRAFNSDNLKKYEALAQICDSNLIERIPWSDIKSTLKSHEVIPSLKSLAITIQETFDDCRWRISKEKSTWLKEQCRFSKIITEEGICYTFNLINSAELFKEDLMPSDFRIFNHKDIHLDTSVERLEDLENEISKQDLEFEISKNLEYEKRKKYFEGENSNEDLKDENSNGSILASGDGGSRNLTLEDDLEDEIMRRKIFAFCGFGNLTLAEGNSSSESNSCVENWIFKTEKKKMTTEWTLEDGYATNEKETYPLRVHNIGDAGSLLITFQHPPHYRGCDWKVDPGFKIFLHTPVEIPQVSKKYFKVSLGQNLIMNVKPNMITTAKGLANYAPERRQCFFNNERNLTFFKVYTQSSCELECLAAFTLKQCGCVKFSMPRDNKTKICSREEISCMIEAEKDLKWSDLMQSLSTGSGINKFGKTDCNCLPSCTSISYDAEIFTGAEIKDKGVWIKDDPISRLQITFKETDFIASKRSERFSFTDFLANCGGIIGLFMGVSILSLVEILYYITLRLACNLNYRRNKKNRKNKKLKAKKNSAIDVDDVPEININGYSNNDELV